MGEVYERRIEKKIRNKKKDRLVLSIIILSLVLLYIYKVTGFGIQERTNARAIKHLEEKYGAEHNFEVNWFEVTAGRETPNILHFYADNMYGERVKGSICVGKRGKENYEDNFFFHVIENKLSNQIQETLGVNENNVKVFVSSIMPQFYGDEVNVNTTVEELYELKDRICIRAYIFVLYDKSISIEKNEEKMDECLKQLSFEKTTYWLRLYLCDESYYEGINYDTYGDALDTYGHGRWTDRVDNINIYGMYIRDKEMGEEKWEN